MLSNKNMILLFLVFALIIIVIFAVAWHFIFGVPNPPLPTAQVTVASSTTNIATSTTSSISTVISTSSTVSTSSDDTDMNPPLPTEQLGIDSVVFNVEIASTMIQQSRGLSNRPSLGANDGMLFVFASGTTQSFWMKDMNFPLDIIWISGNTIVGFAQNDPAAPGVAVPISTIVYSPLNTDKVLEVNAGTVAKYNIKVGDTVTIQ
jgi:uncharacterized protein